MKNQEPRSERRKQEAHVRIARPEGGWVAEPLEALTIVGACGKTIAVTDGAGREYFRAGAAPEVTFAVGGALGTQTVRVLDEGGREVDRLALQVDARTKLEDEGGRFRDLFDILNATMRCYHPSGEDEVTWRGRSYRNFVYWILDHSHTAKGMQYFSPNTAGLVDLLAGAEREDGMIWSFARADPGPGYFDTAYGPHGYARREGGVLFVRQPVENHCEYNFVDAMHTAWKGSGDDAWMEGKLDAAMRALEYGVTDRARWSHRFRLLKRGYTIDSWDFQVEDGHTVKFPLATSQLIDPDRTKFGIFFGDNHGYAYACDELAEMLEHAGRAEDARRYRDRAADIRRRLSELTWNGRFFMHRIEEDPALRRDLGADEKSQIAMSNAYALNRNIPHDQCVAILRTYLDLKEHLPPGSPGEWYSIYPPFGRGFGKDSGRWQYMNAGVHGHAAGELARGAFEHGFEEYGADTLLRLLELGRRHGGMVRFAYTGAYDPPPPPQTFVPVDISGQANMDLWDQGAPGVPGWMGGDPGNDVRNLPVGRRTFADVPYIVPDPETNGRRGAIGVSVRRGFPQKVEVPVDACAGAIYVLHTASGIGPSNAAGAVTFSYQDGAEQTVYMMSGKHLTGWWFPELKSRDAGVAWRGPNPRSNDVGVCWMALANPQPDKRLKGVAFSAALDGCVYAVMGLTLADRPPYHRPDPVSYGGPDNWAGGTCMLALMEGLAGVADGGAAYSRVRLSPRWTAGGVSEVAVTARYAASKGYVAYRYRHDAGARTIEATVTGSGEAAEVRLLLPQGARKVTGASVDGRAVTAREERVEGSLYAVVSVALTRPATVRVSYAK